jgi:ATP-dependent DNA helicase RecG
MRENPHCEFKAEYTPSFLKTVSAFANYGGGTVCFGYSDDGDKIGLDNPKDVRLRIENVIHDAIEPQPDFVLDMDEDSNTVELHVSEGRDTPYLYKGKAYCRRDSSSAPVDRFQYNQLVLKGMNTSYDQLECAEKDLTFHVLQEKLSEVYGMDELDRNTLISLELMTPGGAYTNAAMLLADRNTAMGVDIARFGESINIIESRKTFEHASLLSVLERAMDYFDEIYGYEEVDGTQRSVKWRIPRSAFLQALANALVHREWTIKSAVQVAMHLDRVTVTSPGGLPARTDEERYLQGGLSVPRNPAVASVFFRLGYIERFGTGIPRIVSAYADTLVRPAFDIKESAITVTLPVVKADGVSNVERAVLGVLRERGVMTRDEISSLVGLPKARTLKVLNPMVESGVVVKLGAGRSTRYSLL